MDFLKRMVVRLFCGEDIQYQMTLPPLNINDAFFDAIRRDSEEQAWRQRDERARQAQLCAEAEGLLLEARRRLAQELAMDRISNREFDTHWRDFLEKMERLYTPDIIRDSRFKLGLPSR